MTIIFDPNYITRDSQVENCNWRIILGGGGAPSGYRFLTTTSTYLYSLGFLQIVAKRVGLEEWRRMTVLAVLQKQTGNTLDRMIELVRQHLHVEAYTKAEVKETFCSCTHSILSMLIKILHWFYMQGRVQDFFFVWRGEGTK